MDKVSIIGIDISKRSFQVHGATADGVPVLRRKLTRAKVVEFLASQPRCLVVMERCGGAHHWGREIQQLGHEVRLIAPSYVKAFAKRQKSDARDAAAIVEAAQRPTMRFVAVKTKQAQARSMVYRTARSRSSGEYLFECFMAPVSQGWEPPGNPVRFK